LDFQGSPRARDYAPTLKTKLVSYNQAISTTAVQAKKSDFACTPATLATIATVDAYRAALANFKKRRSHDVTRLRHDQACWAAEMFLGEWGAMTAEFGWSVDDIFAPNGLARWLGVELVTALGPDHAVTETRRIYDRVTHTDWLTVYGAQGNG
jgi:hypothetical protein